MKHRLAVITGVLALSVAISAPASAAPSTYPDPLPDFAHPSAPHNPLLSPASGSDSRPLLVILAVYDENFPGTVTPEQARDRFFASSFGSVGDYYRAQSFNRFNFTPATESEGAANDGVIRVSLGSITNIQTDPSGDFGGPFGRQAVLAADQWINFASFDENGDSSVDQRELAIVVLTQHDDASSCGGTRTITPTTVDGVNLANRQYSFDFGLENNITHAHELAHQAFGTADQFYNVGPYDITSVTCAPGQPYFSFNPWHKLHLGWAQPNVVIRDGYYDVPDWSSTGTSFLLYDHDKGTNDYVLVENRQRGGYDPDLTGTGLTADSGLIVWRIDDSAFGTAAVELLRASGGTTPNFYGGSFADAFDPSDSRTATQREMTPSWRDGTPAKVAIRAIGASGPTVRAYFDVRGPGILVDALRFDSSGAQVTRPQVMQGAPNPVEVDVMNTGEAADTFRFSLTNLPAGWTATTVTRSLAAGEKATVVITVTPPADAAADTSHSLRATGVSVADTDVTSHSPLTLRTPPTTQTSTQLGVTPPSPVVSGTQQTLTATVTPSTAVGSVQFTDGSTPLGNPVTVSNGIASLTTTLPVGGHSLTAVFTPTNPVIFTGSTSTAVPYLVYATATSTTLTAAPNPAFRGIPVFLNATVAPFTATGTVQFKDGILPLGAPVPIIAGTAQFTTSALTPGTHTLTAVFTPTNPVAFGPSTSPPVPLTVRTLF